MAENQAQQPATRDGPLLNETELLHAPRGLALPHDHLDDPDLER